VTARTAEAFVTIVIAVTISNIWVIWIITAIRKAIPERITNVLLLSIGVIVNVAVRLRPGARREASGDASGQRRDQYCPQN